ncbi:hypothetical protein ACFQX6_66985 [Streptosporangium lutulentum]
MAAERYAPDLGIRSARLTNADITTALTRFSRRWFADLIRAADDPGTTGALFPGWTSHRRTAAEPDPGAVEDLRADVSGLTIQIETADSTHFGRRRWVTLLPWLSTAAPDNQCRILLAADAALSQYHEHRDHFALNGQVDLRDQAITELTQIFDTARQAITVATTDASPLVGFSAAVPSLFDTNDPDAEAAATELALARINHLTTVLPAQPTTEKRLSQLQLDDVVDRPGRRAPFVVTEEPAEIGGRWTVTGTVLADGTGDDLVGWRPYEGDPNTDPSVIVLNLPGSLVGIITAVPGQSAPVPSVEVLDHATSGQSSPSSSPPDSVSQIAVLEPSQQDDPEAPADSAPDVSAAAVGGLGLPAGGRFTDIDQVRAHLASYPAQAMPPRREPRWQRGKRESDQGYAARIKRTRDHLKLIANSEEMVFSPGGHLIVYKHGELFGIAAAFSGWNLTNVWATRNPFAPWSIGQVVELAGLIEQKLADKEGCPSPGIPLITFN